MLATSHTAGNGIVASSPRGDCTGVEEWTVGADVDVDGREDDESDGDGEGAANGEREGFMEGDGRGTERSDGV